MYQVQHVIDDEKFKDKISESEKSSVKSKIETL